MDFLSLFALVQAAAESTFTCTTCADACLEEDDPASLLRAQLHACATACRVCADECDRHAGEMEHCGVCAEACRSCAEACDRMKGALVA